MRTHLLTLCLCLNAALLLGQAKKPVQHEGSGFGSVSGFAFGITGGGDLKPARMAKVVLLFNPREGMHKGDFAALVYIDAQLKELKKHADELSNPNENISCRANLLVADSALLDTIHWARQNNRAGEVLSTQADWG